MMNPARPFVARWLRGFVALAAGPARAMLLLGLMLTGCNTGGGSVAIDGVSLTVVGVSDGGFDVALIPHTLAETNLGDRRPGDRVNLEADVLGKYVVHYLERTRA